jgi:cytidylate kinase
MNPFVVAIDGPAAAGKSTTARLVAERLGFLYLDTGAMYRALTWQALEQGVDLDDAESVAALAASAKLEIRSDDGEGKVLLDGEDVTSRIRAPRISRNVSRLAQVPGVRRRMVHLQRAVAQGRSCVVEGRDIGTVVFPEAPVKIYLAASLEERARRRQLELSGKGVEQSLEDLTQEIRVRDAVDSGREDSPLRRAEDAIVVDTTGMSIARQVEAVVRVVRAEMARRADFLEQ